MNSLAVITLLLGCVIISGCTSPKQAARDRMSGEEIESYVSSLIDEDITLTDSRLSDDETTMRYIFSLDERDDIQFETESEIYVPNLDGLQTSSAFEQIHVFYERDIVLAKQAEEKLRELADEYPFTYEKNYVIWLTFASEQDMETAARVITELDHFFAFCESDEPSERFGVNVRFLDTQRFVNIDHFSTCEGERFTKETAEDLLMQ